MALLYLDTSALAKLYLREVGSARMIELAEEGHGFTILSLSRVELRSSIRRNQFQRNISLEDADIALATFAEHLEHRIHLQPVTEMVTEIAQGLIDRHLLRAYDAIQLAGCVALRSISMDQVPHFVASDTELLNAAAKEGFVTINPALR